MSSYGLVTAAVQLGVDAILIKPKRAIGPFTAHVTLREVHTDELEITEQPVDQGAAITDHVFKRPAEVVIEAMWSNSPPSGANIITSLTSAVTGTINGVQSILTGNSESQVKEIYQKLLELQNTGIPFDVFTGKRVYANMLLRSLVQTTDKESENALHVTATLRQVLIAVVQVRTVGAPAENQKDAAATLPSIDKGVKSLLSQAQNFNPAAALRSGIDAVSAKVEGTVTGLVSDKIKSLAGPLGSLLG